MATAKKEEKVGEEVLGQHGLNNWRRRLACQGVVDRNPIFSPTVYDVASYNPADIQIFAINFWLVSFFFTNTFFLALMLIFCLKLLFKFFDNSKRNDWIQQSKFGRRKATMTKEEEEPEIAIVGYQYIVGDG